MDTDKDHSETHSCVASYRSLGADPGQRAGDLAVGLSPGRFSLASRRVQEMHKRCTRGSLVCISGASLVHLLYTAWEWLQPTQQDASLPPYGAEEARHWSVVRTAGI